jgi:predicted RNase H-like nuclease (RuvC/YqgF family)
MIGVIDSFLYYKNWTTASILSARDSLSEVNEASQREVQRLTRELEGAQQSNTWFREYNIASRQQQQQGHEKYLNSQLSSAKAEISALQEEVAALKSANARDTRGSQSTNEGRTQRYRRWLGRSGSAEPGQ